jgi:hypothetical protein
MPGSTKGFPWIVTVAPAAVAVPETAFSHNGRVVGSEVKAREPKVDLATGDAVMEVAEVPVVYDSAALEVVKPTACAVIVTVTVTARAGWPDTAMSTVYGPKEPAVATSAPEEPEATVNATLAGTLLLAVVKPDTGTAVSHDGGCVPVNVAVMASAVLSVELMTAVDVAAVWVPPNLT